MTGDNPEPRDRAVQRLPPVTVDCLECETQFFSRARDQMPVHCPRCGHGVRVKRGPGAQPPPPATAAEPDWDEDEDGDETYMRDAQGRLVPAEWTEEHGLVPLAAERPPAPAPARQRPAAAAEELTLEDALEMYGWRIAARAGGCQVVEAGQPCGGEGRFMLPRRYLKDAWICTRHNEELNKVIIRITRQSRAR